MLLVFSLPAPEYSFLTDIWKNNDEIIPPLISTQHHDDHTRFGLLQFAQEVLFNVPFGFYSNWNDLVKNVSQTERIPDELMYRTETVDALKAVVKTFEDAPPRKEKKEKEE